MATTYNPYKELETIYNAKVGYGNAQTDEERQRLNKIAEQARQRLRDYDYGNLADRTSADGATAADVKKILDSYSNVVDTTTGNMKTGVVGSPAFDEAINSGINGSKKRDNLIYSDHADMHNKYNDILSYANQDITKTDEYKSTFNNIMPYYNYQAMMGRDNELASGAASNGGNIDSYAAANAARQQAALTSKGQMIAHQMGLDAYNSRVSNVGKILSDLGVYNSGVYDALQQGVQNQDQFANTINTALNDQNDRFVKQSAVTGYIPKQWQYSNNPYFNADGTLNEQFTSEAFDNTGGFTTIINNAKAKLATTTDATERANLQATINYATQAKAYKTLNDKTGKYAPYIGEVTGVSPEENAEMKQARMSDATAREALNIDADVSKYAADKEYNATMAGYQNSIDQINAQTEAEKELMAEQAKYSTKTPEDAGTEWQEFYDSFTEPKVQQFLVDVVKNIYDNPGNLGGDVLEAQLIQAIKDNMKNYGINKQNARRILNRFGADTSWLD